MKPYKRENQLRGYEAILEFLDKYLKTLPRTGQRVHNEVALS